MKMLPIHYQCLEHAIKQSPRFGKLQEYLDAGMSAKRYRWDCIWTIPKEQRQNLFSDFYHYLNDDHIDTALRKITNTI